MSDDEDFPFTVEIRLGFGGTNATSRSRSRKNFYVYVHKDVQGNIFYIGKGTGRRAWSKDRHIIWQKYVNERLNNHYTVEIVAKDLTEEDAVYEEEELIHKLGAQLINWINPGRGIDYDALQKYHKLRNENRKLVLETKLIEDSEPERAIEQYRTALKIVVEYESIETEQGIVAELCDWPKHGDPEILNRLVLCLTSVGKASEAIAEAERYFEAFPGALNHSIGRVVHQRIGKLKTGAHKIPKQKSSVQIKAMDFSDLPEGWEWVSENGHRTFRLIRDVVRDKRHYTEFVEIAREYLRSQKWIEAENLLKTLVVKAEIESEKKKETLAPWYSETLAKLYRKIGRIREECFVLKRYISHPFAQEITVAEFTLRMSKAQKLCRDV